MFGIAIGGRLVFAGRRLGQFDRHFISLKRSAGRHDTGDRNVVAEAGDCQVARIDLDRRFVAQLERHQAAARLNRECAAALDNQPSDDAIRAGRLRTGLAGGVSGMGASAGIAAVVATHGGIGRKDARQFFPGDRRDG